MLEKIVFKIGEKEISLTAEEARSLYVDLRDLFKDDNTLPFDPFKKYRDIDWTNPWQPYGPVTYDVKTTAPKPGEIIWLKGDTLK